MKSLVYTMALFLLFIGNVKAQEVIQHGFKPELFKSQSWSLGKYELIQSSIDFYNEETDGYSPGYRPINTQTISARVKREIYDYRPYTRVPFVFQHVLHDFKEQGYEFLYSCSDSDCGANEGWSMYLDSLVGSEEKEQAYVVAKNTLKNKSSKADYIVFYVTNIDNQPRALFDFVYQDNKDKAYFELQPNGYQVVAGKRSLRKTILFSTGSSKLSESDMRALEQIAAEIKDNPGVKYKILGHADNQGSDSANYSVSLRRARSVFQILTNEFRVSPTSIEVKAFGAERPVSSNNGVVSRQQNRRVEIYRI